MFKIKLRISKFQVLSQFGKKVWELGKVGVQSEEKWASERLGSEEWGPDGWRPNPVKWGARCLSRVFPFLSTLPFFLLLSCFFCRVVLLFFALKTVFFFAVFRKL